MLPKLLHILMHISTCDLHPKDVKFVSSNLVLRCEKLIYLNMEIIILTLPLSNLLKVKHWIFFVLGLHQHSNRRA